MTQTDFRQTVRQRVQDSIAVKQALLGDTAIHDQIAAVASCIIESIKLGGKLIVFGNGGSAADAQHFAAEFTGRYLLERQPWPAIALSTNTSSITAIGNDYGYDLVFSRQMEALGNRGDVAIGISTSGNSVSVVRALDVARSKSMVTVAICGSGGGNVKEVAEHCICVPSSETPRIQEAHVLIVHLICELVESSLAV
jgi:D-sedoheptulose 7-phosphate isomerase